MNKPIVAICDNCKNEIFMRSVKIDEATLTLDGQDLILVYFTCPKCNKLYRIMLKDKRYIELQEDLEKTKKRIRKRNGSKDEEFARKLNDIVFKKLERLRNYTERLNAKYSGTFTLVVSENNHKEFFIKYLP